MLAASTIVGPFPLVAIILALSGVKAYTKSNRARRASPITKVTMRGKNLVTLVSLGIYISIYILILDILAVNTVHTSNHEYAPELSRRSTSFNLYVSYITLCCDLLACVFLVFPMLVIIIKRCRGSTGREFDFLGMSLHQVFLLFLVAPVICITSHFGYILLAWITQPSRSTTTLILYYFLLSYLYLVFRMTYKLGHQLDKIWNCCSRSQAAGDESHNIELDNHGEAESPPLDPHEEHASDNPKYIKVWVFFMNLLLGMVFLGLAVIFTLVVYLMPLASEDLFSHLFNVIQFMIVVVSTQYAYKLFAGKQFSFKQVLKHAKKIFHKRYDRAPMPNSQRVGIVEESVDFLTVELLIPHVKRSREYIRGLENGNQNPAEEAPNPSSPNPSSPASA